MKRLTFALIVSILFTVPAFALANAAIDEAAKEKGAVKTSSGMVYFPIKEGNGKSPTANSTVVVDYRGTLTNGKEFDSSYNDKTYPRFLLSRVIPCWTEGLQMMKVGGIAKLVCPPELAYGSHGSGIEIPPNATLIFEIKLVGIE